MAALGFAVPEPPRRHDCPALVQISLGMQYVQRRLQPACSGVARPPFLVSPGVVTFPRGNRPRRDRQHRDVAEVRACDDAEASCREWSWRGVGGMQAVPGLSALPTISISHARVIAETSVARQWSAPCRADVDHALALDHLTATEG